MTNANDIPVANTPAGGYGASFPPLILGDCTEPLASGAPDLRGIWKTISATRGGEPVPADDRLMSYTERIEQCGNRIVDCGGGTIADARADGTEENAVHDVSVFDYTTPIHVVATFEDGAFVLRPVGMPGIEVVRKLDESGVHVQHLEINEPSLDDVFAEATGYRLEGSDNAPSAGDNGVEELDKKKKSRRGRK